MADETTLNVESELPVPMTCANATGIEKGAILTLSNPNTAASTSTDTAICAGIAAAEKIASDGNTTLPVYKRGIFTGTAGVAGVTAGLAIITDGSTSAPNRLVNADVNSENIVGRALSTAASGSTFMFELNPMTINLA